MLPEVYAPCWRTTGLSPSWEQGWAGAGRAAPRFRSFPGMAALKWVMKTLFGSNRGLKEETPCFDIARW